MRRIKLHVNDYEEIESGFFSGTTYLVYAGMNSESTFSIVICGHGGYNSWGYNLYFSDRVMEISLGDKTFRVESVTRNEIILEEA